MEERIQMIASVDATGVVEHRRSRGRGLARAFSVYRFEEAFDRLAEDVVWTATWRRWMWSAGTPRRMRSPA